MTEQYWSQQRIQVLVEAPHGVREVVVAKPFARVGAHPLAEICLPGAQVPRRALYLQAMEDGTYVVDLAHRDGRLGGWFLSDRPIPVGPYRLHLMGQARRGRSDRRSVAPDAPNSAPFPRPLMIVHLEERITTTYTLGRQLTIIGRRPPASIRAMSRLISSVHCALYWTGEQLWAIDLLSTNGTFVDGEAIEARILSLQSKVSVGKLTLIYSPSPPWPSASRVWKEDEFQAGTGDSASGPCDWLDQYTGGDQDAPLAGTPFVAGESSDREETTVSVRLLVQNETQEAETPDTSRQKQLSARSATDKENHTTAIEHSAATIPEVSAVSVAEKQVEKQPQLQGPLAAALPAAGQASGDLPDRAGAKRGNCPAATLQPRRPQITQGRDAEAESDAADQPAELCYDVVEKVVSFGYKKQMRLWAVRSAVVVGLVIAATLLWLCLWVLAARLF